MANNEKALKQTRGYFKASGVVSGVKRNDFYLEKMTKSDKPTLMDWAAVIDRNKGRKEFVLANGLGESIRREHQNYEKEISNLENDNTPFDMNDNKNSDNEMTVNQYQEKIKLVISKMDDSKKKTLKSQLTKAELPTKYSEITDTKILSKILEIISK